MNFIIYYISFHSLQIQFSLIDVMLMGLYEPSNTNKYITGNLNKGQPLNKGKGRKMGNQGWNRKGKD